MSQAKVSLGAALVLALVIGPNPRSGRAAPPERPPVPVRVVTSTEAVAPERGVELDRIVAWIDGQGISLSELVLEARLALLRCRLGVAGFGVGCRSSVDAERFLRRLGARTAALDALARGPGDPTVSPAARRAGELLSGILALSIRRRLLAGEARRLELRAPTDEEVQEGLLELVRRPDRRTLAAGLAAAERLGYAVESGTLPPLLERLLATEQLALQLVELRSRAIPQVREADLVHCARNLRVPLEPYREALTTAMTRLRVERRVQRVALRLEERADIVYAEPFLPVEPTEVPRCPETLE